MIEGSDSEPKARQARPRARAYARKQASRMARARRVQTKNPNLGMPSQGRVEATRRAREMHAVTISLEVVIMRCETRKNFSHCIVRAESLQVFANQIRTTPVVREMD